MLEGLPRGSSFDSVVFVITEGFGENLVINIVFYVLEILVTIRIVKDNGKETL